MPRNVSAMSPPGIMTPDVAGDPLDDGHRRPQAMADEKPGIRPVVYRRRRIVVMSVESAATSRAIAFSTNARSIIVMDFSLFCPPKMA